METEKLKGFLELSAAGAVLIGLVFVGLELRQNTEAVAAASLQNQTDASTDYLLLVASDSDLSRIWLTASTDLSQLSEIDSVRYFLISRARWLRMQNAYSQWRRGALSEEDWLFYNGLICEAGAGGTIRFKSTWAEHQPMLTDSFVEFVEICWSDSQ